MEHWSGTHAEITRFMNSDGCERTDVDADCNCDCDCDCDQEELGGETE